MEKWWMLSVMSAKRKSGEPMLSDSADGYEMPAQASENWSELLNMLQEMLDASDLRLIKKETNE
jgi:hypothetical protein